MTKKYIALTGLNNDKTGKRFDPGDTVTNKDFSKSIIQHWLQTNRIAEYVGEEEPDE